FAGYARPVTLVILFFRGTSMKNVARHGTCPSCLHPNNLSIERLLSANTVFNCPLLCDAQIHNQNKTSGVLIRRHVLKNKRTDSRSISFAELRHLPKCSAIPFTAGRKQPVERRGDLRKLPCPV